MELFGPNPSDNLLPCDGVVNYFGPILGPAESRRFLGALLGSVPWAQDEVVIFGKRIVTTRKVAWYADDGLSYAYSGTIKQAQAWTPELLELKALVERQSGERFNSCLLNLYHHGGDGMGWHSDDERSLARNGAIASVSLGAERKFSFKHKNSKETVSLNLEDGSLLVMKGQTQTHWVHSLPKTKRVTDERINLTFRTMA